MEGTRGEVHMLSCKDSFHVRNEALDALGYSLGSKGYKGVANSSRPTHHSRI